MRIAICEDENNSLINLKKQIGVFCTGKNITGEIDCFSCGIDFIASQNQYEIIFMDIYLPDIIGTDVIRRLSGRADSQVVFTTNSREHAVEAFGLNAAHYLVKPLTQETVNQALERCLDFLGKEALKILEVKSGQGIVPIPTKNIAYIEVFNKISMIHTKKNVIQTYASLDALFEILDEHCFMRAQRSFIVNMNYIDFFSFDRLFLQDGTEIMLSRNNRAELKKQYQRFLFDLARRGDV